MGCRTTCTTGQAEANRKRIRKDADWKPALYYCDDMFPCCILCTTANAPTTFLLIEQQAGALPWWAVPPCMPISTSKGKCVKNTLGRLPISTETPFQGRNRIELIAETASRRRPCLTRFDCPPRPKSCSATTEFISEFRRHEGKVCLCNTRMRAADIPYCWNSTRILINPTVGTDFSKSFGSKHRALLRVFCIPKPMDISAPGSAHDQCEMIAGEPRKESDQDKYEPGFSVR
jgi:hypothetical protein